MAAATEIPSQFDRDLRSAHQGWKRDKDSNTKWMFGFMPIAGVQWNQLTGEIMNDVPDIMLSKGRPFTTKHCLMGGPSTKRRGNVVKQHRPLARYNCGGNGRLGGRRAAEGEIDELETSRSLVDMAMPSTQKEAGAGAASLGLHSMDGVLYSFDAAGTPSRSVTLETFIKANNRTTEKLIEKEYEILDVNGELLKGRKARKDLHKSAGGIGGEDDDEDFELV